MNMTSRIVENTLNLSPVTGNLDVIDSYHAIQAYLATHPGTVLTTYGDVGVVAFICMCIAFAVGWLSAIFGKTIAARIKQSEYDRVMKQQQEG